MKTDKSTLRRINLYLVLILLFLLLLGAVTLVLLNVFGVQIDSAITVAFTAAESIGLVISLVIAIRQLSDSKKIARATFISELNKSFVENKNYVEVYNALQSCYDNACACSSPCGDKFKFNVECSLKEKITKGQISNYLTFFETVYILIKDGAISFSVIDDLFAYRFFLAVHSKIVQQEKIKNQPFNFKNIFCLEYEWLKWRKENGKYNPDSNSIYNNMLLRDIVTEQEYAELIKDCK